MCLVAFAWRCHARHQLILAGNRDEYFARPSTALAWWAGEPDVLGGRDEEAGGTWLGVARSGRLAAVTNFREAAAARRGDANSRGRLVADFLTQTDDANDYLQSLWQRRDQFNGYSLILADGLGSAHAGLWLASNRDQTREQTPAHQLAPGVYAVSNGRFGDPWPKVERARTTLAKLLDLPDDRALVERLFELLRDREVPSQQSLPVTGVSPELERSLAPIFVRLPGYGTRSSSVLTCSYTGDLQFSERSFAEDGTSSERAEAFRIVA